MKTQRLFIAIKITNTNHICNLFRQVQFDLRQEQIKWVDTKGLHLTLSFLGETDVRKIPLIKLRLNNMVRQFSVFSMCLSGLGAFPTAHRPRILWAGVESNQIIFDIQKEIVKQMEFIVNIGDKRFAPHITLGRIKHGVRDKERLKCILQKYKNWQDEVFKVKEIVLMESKITREGPIYNVMEQFELNDF